MSDTPTQSAGYAIYTPGIYERIIRRLGFRMNIVDLPDNADKMSGWMMTETRVTFSFADRLRLLATGRLMVSLRQATNVQVDDSISAASLRIYAPWERFGQ